MNIIDISWDISVNMTGYKNKKEFEFVSTKIFDIHSVRESKITIGTHAGTHVDAPSHMIEEGITIDKVPLENLVGSAVVLDLSYVKDKITGSILADHVQDPESIENKIVLCKTKNSLNSYTQEFDANFIYLDYSAAEYCVENNIKAVGVDYLGIERGQKSHPTHKVLFNNNITIVEGLRLESVQEGEYYFVCLPLKIKGLDGSPARAILIKDR